MITLRQLEFALAVAKYKHFKRAAEECNISQSALSLGIAELEKQLDTQIFERNNKQVLITPIGEEILERATRIFAEVNDLVTRAQTHQTPLLSDDNWYHPNHCAVFAAQGIAATAPTIPTVSAQCGRRTNRAIA